MKQFLFFIFLSLTLTSCSYYVMPPKVNTKIETTYSYNINRNFERSKLKKIVHRKEYTRYDKNSKIIEIGIYGEAINSQKTSITDSSISIETGYFPNFNNLDYVIYLFYDSTGKQIEEFKWNFKNNKKEYLIDQTTFEYDSSGTLIKKTTFDKNNLVSRVQYFSKINMNMKLSIDTLFFVSSEGISKIDGINIDTTITDTTGRPLRISHYHNNKISFRQEFLYNNMENTITEMYYEPISDTLDSYTEWQYNIDKRLIQKFWKVTNSNIETKDVYIYNRKKLLVKILHFDREELTGYTRFKYKLY